MRWYCIWCRCAGCIRHTYIKKRRVRSCSQSKVVTCYSDRTRQSKTSTLSQWNSFLVRQGVCSVRPYKYMSTCSAVALSQWCCSSLIEHITAHFLMSRLASLHEEYVIMTHLCHYDASPLSPCTYEELRMTEMLSYRVLMAKNTCTYIANRYPLQNTHLQWKNSLHSSCTVLWVSPNGQQNRGQAGGDKWFACCNVIHFLIRWGPHLFSLDCFLQRRTIHSPAKPAKSCKASKLVKASKKFYLGLWDWLTTSSKVFTTKGSLFCCDLESCSKVNNK